MPDPPTYPGAYNKEPSGDARAITGVACGAALFLGWAARGPTDRAVHLSSFRGYERQFGGLDHRSFLGFSVKQFYDNGGADAFVLRLTDADREVFGPRDASFQAAVLAAFTAGGGVDRIDRFDVLCVPGLTDATTIAALQQACHARRAFFIVDCDEDATISTVLRTLPGLTGPHALNSALYFPWVRSPDPLRGGALRACPPSGFVAGVYARTDRTRGVWKAPAGTEATLHDAADLTVRLSDAENGSLNQRGINCLRTLPAYGNVVWGSRTLLGDDGLGSEWKYVPVRRTALFLEESIARGTRWVVFEPNDEPSWARIRLAVGAFLHDLFRSGAFQGATPEDAYFVKCDRETMTEAEISLGIVNIVVGFAPLRPAEFVVIRVRQMAEAA
jgi:uncharacterized protein